MKLHSLFVLSVFLLCTWAYSVNPEAEIKPNVTVPKSPTLPTSQEISEPHVLAEPPKQNDTKTLQNKPTSSSSTSSTATPGIVIITPVPKSTAASLPSTSSTSDPNLRSDKNAKGREGVVNEKQLTTYSISADDVNNITTASRIAQPVLSTPVPSKVSDPKDSSNNSTVSGSSRNTTLSSQIVNATSSSTSQPPSSSTATSSSTSTTTTTKTTTSTTTTTPKPMKPTVTYSIEDNPTIANVSRGKIHDRTPQGGKLHIEMPEPPVAQPSMEVVIPPIHRDYFISVVAIVFAVPIIMGAMIVMVRRFKDYWSTRHYRRMDFLVDGMYND